MTNWSTQVVTLLWFWSNGAEVLAEGPFEDFHGFAPDNVAKNRVPGSNGLLSSAQSVREGNVYVANVQPGRLEITVARADDPKGGPMAWDLATGQKTLNGLVERFEATVAARVSAATRLAAHIRMFINAPSAIEANQVLQREVGLGDLLAKPLDLTFQFNQRISSASSEGIQINRLLRYDTGALTELVFDVNLASISQPPGSIERHYANVLIDVNTVPTGAEYDLDRQKRLLRELAAEAVRISQNPVPASIK